MAGEFSGDSEWRVVVADELLFVFGFIRASILCDDGLDYARAMAYGLASQISISQHVNVCSLTRNDMQVFGLDFISHPEGCNGENNLGCC
jgi:hypothetical protein